MKFQKINLSDQLESGEVVLEFRSGLPFRRGHLPLLIVVLFIPLWQLKNNKGVGFQKNYSFLGKFSPNNQT